MKLANSLTPSRASSRTNTAPRKNAGSAEITSAFSSHPGSTQMYIGSTKPNSAGRRAASGTTQPTNHRMGQLLLLGPCQQSLSRSGRTHSPQASPVAVRQTSTEGSWYHAVLRPAPARQVWTGSACAANRQLSVGNPVNLSPRAGCAKRARPVR